MKFRVKWDSRCRDREGSIVAKLNFYGEDEIKKMYEVLKDTEFGETVETAIKWYHKSADAERHSLNIEV